MMSSKEVNLLSISLKQYFYKLKAYTGLINRLIITQILALLFSLPGGIGMISENNGEITVTIRNYSASMVMVFAFFWIVTVAIMLTTKQYKKMDSPLVTNRISGNLSDVGFLMTASVFAGMTSSLVGVLFRVIMYFTFDRSMIVYNEFFLTPSDLLLGMVAAILYMTFISALGYFIGMLAQVSMAFVICIPAVIFGVLRVNADLVQSVIKFYVGEASLPLFALKILITSIVLFGISIGLSNRMEVGQ